MNHLPGNPYTEYLAQMADNGANLPATAAPVLQISATLALAYEQHRTARAAERAANALEQRVRLAAITADSKGLPLPRDLAALAHDDPTEN